MRRMLFAATVALLAGVPALAQQTPVSPGPEAEFAAPAAEAPEVLTLRTMVEQGGAVLWVIMGLAFIALVMTLYLLLTVTARREVPHKLYRRIKSQVLAGDFREAFHLCQDHDNLLANVLGAGLRLHGHDRFVVQEAMQSAGDRGAAALQQRVAILNHIAQIAPLLGLLGTVWGMMQAFSAIAFDNAQVKGLSMAYAVSEAMITTAAGLALAIPALVVYFYLKGRVLRITAQAELQAAEVLELMADRPGGAG